MEITYRYIGVGRHYFCPQQSVVLLACILISSSGRARLAALELAPAELLTAAIKISLYRLGAHRRARTLALPYFGNVCRAVHGGYKLFDFRRGSVIKCFSPQLERAAVEREIALNAARGTLDYSPDLISYSIAQRWYEEVFIAAEPGVAYYGAHNTAFWTRFHSAIAPCVGRILRIEPLTRVRLGDICRRRDFAAGDRTEPD